MLEHKTLLVLAIVLVVIFAACENPTESMNTVWDPPSDWYLFPTWSPTGEWIAYEYYGPDGPRGIWLVRPDGSENYFETRGILADFSPDGKKLAFARGEKIFVRDLETGEEAQLTFKGSSFFPSWSPDGKKIAYDSNYQDPKGANVIWTMENNGEGKKDISQHGIGEWRDPDWLPDFRLLHRRYSQGRSGADLFVMDSTGLNEIRLTTDGRENLNARVSPNGDRIVWERWLSTSDAGFAFWTAGIGVWLMNADGNDQKWLAEGFEPAWAPDGRHIIFRKRGEYIGGEPYDDDDPKVHGSLWIMNVETGEERQLLPRRFN